MGALNIIFRVTDKCNLRCTYCYDSNNHCSQQNPNNLFSDNIDNIVHDIINIANSDHNHDSINLTFHGGEPLLISPSNYMKLIEKLNSSNIDIEYSMQTNGTLINQKFIELFKKYNFSVGISLDGFNEKLNDLRIYSNGRNSFSKCMYGINLLKQNNINFGIIMTITRKHIGYEKELYKFIADNNLNCNIRPAFPNNSRDISITNSEYFDFFKTLFNMWYNDNKEQIKLHQIPDLYEEFRKAIDIKYNSKQCSSGENCFENFISMNIHGDIYSCNRLYGNPKFYYGNIRKDNFQILINKASKMIRNRKIQIKSKCNGCILIDNCNGGCPAIAEKYSKNYCEKDFFCESKKEIHNYIKNIVNLNL